MRHHRHERSADRNAGPPHPPPPADPPAPSALPHPLTFFLTAGQRAAVLRALRRVDPDRSAALRRALAVP